MNEPNYPDTPVDPPAREIVTVLVVCSSLLERLSLQTTINAITPARVIAKTADAATALHLVQTYSPDVLIVDAYSLEADLFPLLKRASELRPTMIRVVLLPGPTHELSALPGPADFVVNQANLTNQFVHVLSRVKAHRAGDNHGH